MHCIYWCFPSLAALRDAPHSSQDGNDRQVVQAGVRQGAMEGIAESFAVVGPLRRYSD